MVHLAVDLDLGGRIMLEVGIAHVGPASLQMAVPPARLYVY